MYTVYKTTNKVNGRYYIGVHKTSKPNDEYLGSGKLLNQAIALYGRESFIKEILFVYENHSEAFSKEKELLEQHLDSDLCYNLKQGGDGGWRYVHENGLTNKNKTKDHYVKMGKAKAKILQEKMQDPEYKKQWVAKMKHNHMWITDGVKNTRIKPGSPMPEGYRRGRTL
jgi:hypothetical protein